MPAAAVIPAPLAYIKVVAVKKLVVGSVSRMVGAPLAVFSLTLPDVLPVDRSSAPSGVRAGGPDSLRAALNRAVRWAGKFTLNKFECSKQAASRLKTVCME